LTAAGLSIASPAHAAPFAINDSFENNPAARWTIQAVTGLTNVTMGAHTQPGRTGPNMAVLNAYPDSPATATIFRTFTPDPALSSPIRADVYLRRLFHQGETNNIVIVFLRIRTGGPTGSIISVSNTQVEDTNVWLLRSFNEFRPTGPFTVEISAHRGTALVDDLQLRFSVAI
jgi:hypothetical protein